VSVGKEGKGRGGGGGGRRGGGATRRKEEEEKGGTRRAGGGGGRQLVLVLPVLQVLLLGMVLVLLEVVLDGPGVPGDIWS
jgi:hypothetical protein